MEPTAIGNRHQGGGGRGAREAVGGFAARDGCDASASDEPGKRKRSAQRDLVWSTGDGEDVAASFRIRAALRAGGVQSLARGVACVATCRSGVVGGRFSSAV